MSGSQGKGTDFWSRRKAAVRDAEDAERAEREALADAEYRDELEQKTDAEILDELELPDPETLSEEDDFSRFLSAKVPDHLRRRALRRLWGLNPVLANLDGLVDYADDFTDAATVIPDLQTVYKIGKGMLEQFAGEDAQEELKSAVQAVETESTFESSSELQCEENIASHNDGGKKRIASMQLTEGDDLVQSRNAGADSLDLQEIALTEDSEEPRQTRRRMRFDYS
ncbi:MAG: DUF3306 domain-containing protein [Roseibium sp.]|uniref:DUF3306 domain-containing protein n=1 Tax=Roseibium sp. TaxID=1936156 RepID=UPI00261C590A|nr:DUF3306 domain-containing protein [Roseibium sp.]MCV0424577.1 DUF3306 domain-containing protein [Roseibium sp.]